MCALLCSGKCKCVLVASSYLALATITNYYGTTHNIKQLRDTTSAAQQTTDLKHQHAQQQLSALAHHNSALMRLLPQLAAANSGSGGSGGAAAGGQSGSSGASMSQLMQQLSAVAGASGAGLGGLGMPNLASLPMAGLTAAAMAHQPVRMCSR